MRGSRLARVQWARTGHGVHARRGKRTSHTVPFWGYVLGSQDRLCWPVGQVTTRRSQSTTNWLLAKPSPARACQLGSAASGPTSVTPYRRSLSTSTRESV